MKKYYKTSLIIIVLCITSTFSRVIAQTEKQEPAWQHHIGTSLFMGFNLLPDPADYYMLNYWVLLVPERCHHSRSLDLDGL